MILIGKKIKELRKKHKFTQVELATKIGVTKSTVAAYENDSRQPSYEVLLKMAYVFRVSIDSLLLDQTEQILNLQGLTEEQIDILKILTTYFKKINSEDFKTSLEPFDLLQKYLDTKIDN